MNNNRSAKLFKHVLNYMRDSDYPYPEKYKSELDYYEIEYWNCSLYLPQSFGLTDNLLIFALVLLLIPTSK